MACGCQSGQYGSVAEADAPQSFQSAPKDAPVRVFSDADVDENGAPRWPEGARRAARLYAARNGGGSVRTME